MQQYHTPSSNVVNQAPKQFQLPPPNSAEQLVRNQELIAAAGRGDLATVRRLHEAGAIQLSPLGQDGNQSALAAAVTTYQNNHDTATNGFYTSSDAARLGNAMLQTSKSCAGVIRYLLDNGTDWNSLTPNQQSAARRALT